MSKVKKVYITAPAASGKSTFVNENPYYSGFKVVDFAKHLVEAKGLTKLILFLNRAIPGLRYFVRNDKTVIAREDGYYEKIFSFLRSQDEPIVVLGRQPPENLDEYNDIKFAAVIVPEEIHKRNCKGRKREMRNPLPFFHHWTTDFKKLEPIREQIALYSKRHDIEIFDSFTAAINSFSEAANH